VGDLASQSSHRSGEGKQMKRPPEEIAKVAAKLEAAGLKKVAAPKAEPSPSENWSLGKVLTDSQVADYTDGDGAFVELNATKHIGFGLLVWRMDDEERSPECEALAKRVVAVLNAQAAPNAEPDEIEAWRKAANDAATSLETISKLAGRDELLTTLADIRAYAGSRASAAREGIDAAIAAAKENK
jgi:hypothetical protein